MAARSSAPLTQADYTALNNTLRDLEGNLRDIERAAAAGIECAQEDAFCRDVKARLEKVKSIYFPDMP